jgi:cytochrome c biogenesis protein CcmG/thiol:disulfide interchange protein DsbE
MKHPARWIALAVALVVAAFSVVLATQVGDDPRADTTRSALVGKAVPDFSARALDGERVSSASLAGKAVIVNFWNTWCTPCNEELPALKEFYKQHADDPDFAMVGIVRDDTKSAVEADVADEKLRWTIAMDPGSKAALAFGTRGQPETFAISPDGVVVGAQIGASTVRYLEQLLAAARGTRS